MSRSHAAAATMAAQSTRTVYTRRVLQALYTAVSKEEARENLNCLWLFSDGCAMATDGHRLVAVRGTGDDAARPTWNDAKFWSAPLARIGREDIRLALAWRQFSVALAAMREVSGEGE